MPDIKYNLLNLLDDLSMYEYVTSTPLQDLAYYGGSRAEDYAYDYGFIDWSKDAKHDLYRNVQKGEMQESADIMAASRQNIEDAQELLNLYDLLLSKDQKEVDKARNNIATVLDRMKKNGVINTDDSVTVDDLNKIILDNQENYNDAYEKYKHDEEQYNNDMGKHDISQYYTRKSNESMLGTGKWYFTMPATMGTSMTSPFLLTASMIANIAVGFLTSPLDRYVPYASHFLALGAALLFGGAKAREYESHMEAFNSYYETLLGMADDEHLDLKKVAGNARDQLNLMGVDTSNYDDSMLIQRLLFDQNLKSGSAGFDRIAKKAYEGTRRVYEQNNALGFGEALSDFMYTIPVGKIGKFGLRVASKAMKPMNKLTGALTKRFNAGVELAKLGAKMRSRAWLNGAIGIAAAQVVHMIEEGTEEGAQYIISERQKKGYYNDLYANDDFFDALFDGQLFSDLADNIWLRARSLGAVFDIDSEYKNDQQMMEEMLAGALLPFTSPQAAVGNVHQIYNYVTNAIDTKKAGDYISEALSTKDQINRNAELFKTMRELSGNGRNYYSILDSLQEELKKKDKTGKVNKYNLDSTVLTDDGSIPTDADIDEFFKDQKEEYKKLMNIKAASSKQLKQLNLQPEDLDLFLALKYNAEQDLKRSLDLQKANVNANDALINQLLEQGHFKKYLDDNGIKIDEKNAPLLKSAIAAALVTNSSIEHIDNAIDNVNSLSDLLNTLKGGNFTTAKHVVDSAKTLIALLNQRDKLLANKRIVTALLKDVDNADKIMNLTPQFNDSEQLSQFEQSIKNLVDTDVFSQLLSDKYKDLNSTDSEFIQLQVDKYRQSFREEEMLADSDNEAARTGTEPVVPELLKPMDKIKDLTREDLDLNDDQLTAAVNANVEQFKQLVNSIPDSSYLRDIRDKINKYVGDLNNVEYARFVVGLMDRMKKDYAEKIKSGTLSEEDKTKLENLQSVAETFRTQINDLLNVRAENKARAERHPAGLSADSSVWFDEDGNRYMFNMSKSEYSENEGLVLHMLPLSSDDDDIDNQRVISQLEGIKQKLQDKKYEEGLDDEQKRDQNTIESIDKMIDQLKDNPKNPSEIIVRADDAMLDQLYTVRNDGTRVSFRDHIKPSIKTVDTKIKTNRDKRLRKDYTTRSVEGDVREFSTNGNGKTGTLRNLEELAAHKKSGEVVPVAYPLNTTNGKASSTKLLNPYYQSRYWYGKITMPYASIEHAKKYLSKDVAITKRNGKTYDAYEAIELFNKIGGQIVYLRDHNRLLEGIDALKALINGDVKEAKIGGSKVTVNEFDDMVFALPLMSILYNPRTGKQRTSVFLSSLVSKYRSEEVEGRDDAEFKSRAELICNLLHSYKRTDKQDSVTEQDGMTSEENDAVVSNAVYIKEGGVLIVYGDFNYNVYTEVDTESNTFTNSKGEKMSKKEINQYYKDHLNEAVTNISQHIDELVTLLKELGYSGVTKEKLLEEKDGESNLVKFIEGTIKFGDGFIDLKLTYIPDYITPTLGAATKTSSPSEANQIRARRILSFFLNKTPESFLTYKNFQDENNLTPSVSVTLEDVFNRRLFNGERSIKVYMNNERVDTSDSPENRELLKKMFQSFEKLIRESRSAEEFLNTLHDMGYSFGIGESNDTESLKTADGILMDYFNNRRFSRLRQPSNIVNAITLGTSIPLNKYADFDSFNRQSRHRFGKLSELWNLGLVKNDRGQYYFSLEKFVNNYTRTKRENDEDQPTEFEVLEQELKLERDKQLAQINEMKTKEEVANWLIDHKDMFEDEQYDDLLRVNRNGLTVLRYSVKYTKTAITDAYNSAFDELAEQRKLDYLESIKKDARSDSEFAGLRVLPLMFAYGSYNSDATGTSVVYFDAKGNKMTLSTAGTPGAMYLVIPHFLTSSGRRQIVHLNPKRFDLSTARAIAGLLREVVVNKRNINSFVNEITTSDGITFKSNATIKTVLDSIIFNGKQAILNDPNDNNYARLLNYNESNNTIEFGEDVANADNFDSMMDQLVNFIMEKKTYRVDRDKATNNSSTFGIDLSITDAEGNSLLDVKADDNYIAYIVDNGVLLTDINPNKGESVFTQPRVYLNYNKKYNFTVIPNDSKSEGSTANARQKVKDELPNPISREELAEEAFKSDEKDPVKYASDLMKNFLNIVDQLYANHKIEGDTFRIGYYRLKKNDISRSVEAKFEYDSTSNEMKLSATDRELNQGLLSALAQAHRKGYNAAVVLLDEDGNFIEVDGKKVLLKVANGSGNATTSGTSTNQGSSSEVQQLISALFELVKGLKSPTSQTQQQLQQQPAGELKPVGYVGLTVNKKEQPKNQPAMADKLDNPNSSFEITDDGIKLTADGVTVTVPKNASEDDLDEILAQEEDITDEVFNKFSELLKKAQNALKTPSAQPTKKSGFNLGNAAFPGQLFVQGNGTQSANTTGDPVIPKWSQVRDFAQKDADAKQLYNKIQEQIKSGLSSRALLTNVAALFMKHIMANQPQFKNSYSKLAISLLNNQYIKGVSNSLAAKMDPNVGSVLSFLSDFVQKEDFDAAMKRAEAILGKDFDLTFLADTPRVWDNNRQAMIYVFGQCAVSGIRLFRDANNQIAKGSLYHEAFHRISLFVLSNSERQRMYKQARQNYPETAMMADSQVEEFLADRFADFVGDSEQRKGGKYYSSNPVHKFFQIIFDKIRLIINKLTSANITPKYVNMNKLFLDMYSGRYAYAKATKNNIEEFLKVYSSSNMPYAGFKVNGVEIANSAVLYNEIFRDLIGRFIRTSDLLTVKNGLVHVDMNLIKASMLEELNTYINALTLLDRQIRLSNSDPSLAAMSDDMSVAAVLLGRLIGVYRNILRDEAWSVWTDVVKGAVEHNFNISKESEDNPEEVANEDTVENEYGEQLAPNGGEGSLQYSKIRDSYMTDTFNAADVSMKMLLWSITQYDLNNPGSAKFTEDGLMKYSNVKQLYRKVIDVVHTATDIQDMLDKLEAAGRNDAEKLGDYSLLQLFLILSDEDNNKAIRNRFFTDFVRHIHEFKNFDWEQEEVTVPTADGSTTQLKRYTASVKSGNVETMNLNLSSRWKSNMVTKFAQIESDLKQAKTSAERNKMLLNKKSVLQNALKHLNYNNLLSIQNVITATDDLFGFGMISGNVVQDAITYQKMMSKNRNDGALRNAVTSLLMLSSASYLHNKDNKENEADKRIKDLFGEKGILTNLSQTLSQYAPPTPKSTSQMGPNGTKIYSIGAYNFITRLLAVRSKTSEWLDRMKLNPYSQHSLWLKAMINGGEASRTHVGTKLSTMLDNDYQNSIADIDVTETEELLNRFVTTLSGYHQIPSLANKRFAATVTDLGMFQDTFDSFGTINKRVIDTFVGYLADEILAISDAMYLRNQFISKLNEATGRKLTVDSFSNMTAIKQEELFKSNPQAAKLLNMLVKQYHFVDGDPYIVLKTGNNGEVYFRRAFHIDLREGTGYKFRHFGQFANGFKFTDDVINSLSLNSLTDTSRVVDATVAYNIANNYRPRIVTMLRQNIGITINKFIDLGLIDGDRVNIEDPKMPSILTNIFLPKNLISNGSRASTDDIYKAIGRFTVQGMSDMIEFEKIVSGDIGYHKNITSVNKRYSGIVSTIQITSNESTMLNQLTDDRLYNNPIFNTVTVNTSKIANTAKFRGDMINALGIDTVTGFEVDKKRKLEEKGEQYVGGGDVVPIVDIDAFFDSEGKIYPQAVNSPLISRYLDSRDNLRTAFYDDKGRQLSKEEVAKLADRQVVEQAVKSAINRFSGYLNNDPTDASVFITADMFRQVKQREGKWNDIDEACFNLLENYDILTELAKSPSKLVVLRDMCDTLGISYDDLMNRANQYNRDVATRNTKGIRNYKGYILGVTSQFDATSLKYVYYGDNQGRSDNLIVPIYDKMSLSPIFKIFADDHQMSDVYKFMKDNEVDMLKFESAVKSGGVASFELFDDNGDIDTRALESSVVQQQYFELLGKQLNTDPHHSNEAALLTQFMKIAMMNVSDDETYRVGDNNLTGKQIKDLYRNILDTLTDRGYAKFKADFGITDEGLDKTKFMLKLSEIVAQLGLPADTLAAFTTDANGEFVIHPSAIPSINFIQSRILSEVGKKIIETTTPGQPLYQVASVGYDNLFNFKQQADNHLLMPGEMKPDGTLNTRMLVKLSINFFADVIREAKEKGVKGYDLDNFEDQRRFILDNKELFALSYRVPTQGQNSTIAVEIVDLFPPQRGAIASFPAGITALTGSDFDIDKMFLARPNCVISNGRIRKLQYNVNDILKDTSKASNKELQNLLLDMYQTVLTSSEHYLAANTPLDVCTAPLKNFTTQQIRMEGLNEGDYENTIPGYYTNPVFQTAQKVKNSGSDNGIAPMALNSVFRFFIQTADLRLTPIQELQLIGILNLNKVYDRNGEDILDVTSALINAHVDAVKDNYIGEANVNAYTYDVTSFLTTAGLGNDTFAFLCQPILKEVAKNWQNYKNGHIAVPEDLSKGSTYLSIVREDYLDKYVQAGGELSEALGAEYATPAEMSVDYMLSQIKTKNKTKEFYLQQIKYLNTFELLKNIAQGYRDAITVAQIDTKKYGISANDIISFMQALDQFTSIYNSTFLNPSDLFDNTFLGNKYEKAIESLFETFNTTIFEFSETYKNELDKLCREYGKFGRYSKNFIKRVGSRLKTAMFLPFFNLYLINRYKAVKPLFALTAGDDSVPARLSKIRAKALSRDEGVALFDVLKYNSTGKSSTPQFMLIDNIIRDDEFVRSNVQAAMSELFESDDAEIRQWMNDFAVYMFYVTGGSDANAGGLIKTSIYDLIPPQHLANISIQDNDGNTYTFNQYVELLMNNPSISSASRDIAMRLVALSDDSIIPVVSRRKGYMVMNATEDGNVVAIGKGSNSLLTNGTQYIKYIKVPDKQGVNHTYQLGNIVVTLKGFVNPVYFRIDDLGFRNQVRATLSIRADGYETADGQVRSLLSNDLSFQAREISQLANESYALRRLKPSAVLSIEQSVDANNVYDIHDEKIWDLLKIYCAIDKSRAIYVTSEMAMRFPAISDYSSYKYKDYLTLYDGIEDGLTSRAGDSITILGTITPEMMSAIVTANPGKSILYLDDYCWLTEMVDGKPVEQTSSDKSTENVMTQRNVNVKGENISSRGSEFAKKLTNLGNSVSVTFRGVKFRNSEHAYLTWKSGEFDEVAYNSSAVKPRGSKRVNTAVNFDIMVEIITAKLQLHPELVQGINDRGGLDYILNSTHNVIGDKYWESSGLNKFIEALYQAAVNVGITNKGLEDDVSNLAKLGKQRRKEC